MVAVTAGGMVRLDEAIHGGLDLQIEVLKEGYPRYGPAPVAPSILLEHPGASSSRSSPRPMRHVKLVSSEPGAAQLDPQIVDRNE